MLNKNINITTNKETIVPICYIDKYKDNTVNKIFKEYKFKNSNKCKYLLDICIDICIDVIIKNPDSYIVFTYPPSTMFYRKEKSIDSQGNLIFQVNKYLNFYFKKNNQKYYFKNLFSINNEYIKNKKAQHIDSSKRLRIKNIDKRYYMNFWNRLFLLKLNKRKNIIIIIDDVSSTGATLFACKNVLINFNKKTEVELFSLAH